MQPKSRPLGKCRGADLPLKIGSSVVHRLILLATPLRRGHSGIMSDWPEFCLYPKSRSLAMDAEKMPCQSIGSYLMKFRCEIHPPSFLLNLSCAVILATKTLEFVNHRFHETLMNKYSLQLTHSHVTTFTFHSHPAWPFLKILCLPTALDPSRGQTGP